MITRWNVHQDGCTEDPFGEWVDHRDYIDLNVQMFEAQKALINEGMARAKADAEVLRLRGLIDCACNALTDSINVSGNQAETNIHWVRRLRRDALASSTPTV